MAIANMKPPICSICNTYFDLEEGGLVTFVPDAEDAVLLEKFKQPGFVGHPPNQFWFCGVHIDAARKVRGLTKGEAFKTMRGEK